MSAGQIAALFSMSIVGVAGLCAMADAKDCYENFTVPKLAVIFWVAVWLLPPATALFIKGVFG